MKNSALAGIGAITLATAANATFHGIAVNEAMVGTTCVVDVYATFDANPTGSIDVLLSVSNINITFGGGFSAFLHNDFVGGTWGPQGSTSQSMDSYCVIGGTAGFSNATTADANWGPLGFNQIPIPSNAGWFNNNPPNLQGKAAQVNLVDKTGQVTWNGLATRIMRLAFIDPGTPGFTAFTIAGASTYNQGLGTLAQQGTFDFAAVLCDVPAPGAPALLGLGVVAAGRRRRT